MPSYEVQLPDGRIVQIESARPLTDAQIRDAVTKALPVPSSPPPPARQPGLVERAKSAVSSLWRWLNRPRPAAERMAQYTSPGSMLAQEGMQAIRKASLQPVVHEARAIGRMAGGLADVHKMALESLAKTLVSSPGGKVLATVTGLGKEREQLEQRLAQAPSLPALGWAVVKSPFISIWQTVTRPQEAYEEKGLTGMLLDLSAALGLAKGALSAGMAVPRITRAAARATEALKEAPKTAPQAVSEARAGAGSDVLASKGTAVVPPAPAPPAPTKLQQLVQAMQEAAGKPIRLVKSIRGSRGAEGAYEPAQARVQVRRPTSPLTAAHEIAHYWDDKYKIVGEWAKPRAKSPYDEELFNLPGVSPKGKLADRRAEGVARYIEVYVQNPAEAQRLAPRFSEYLKQKLPQQEWQALDEFSGRLRAYLNLPPVEQAKANIRFWWEKPTLKERLQGIVQPRAGRFTTWLDVFRRELTDEYAPLVRAAETAAQVKGITPKPSQNPIMLLRLWHGFNEKFHDVIERGVPLLDQQGTPVGRATGGLNWLLEPARGRTPEEVRQLISDAQAYEVAQRTLELAQRFGREDNLTGIGGGVRSDVEQAKLVLRQLENHERLKDIAELSRRYKQWADSVLQYAVKKGRLSPETYRRIKAANAEYVSLQRDMVDWNARHFGDDLRDLFGIEEPAPAVGKVGSEKYITKRIKGSSRQIKDPIVSLLEDSYRIMREADRNEVMRTFVDLIAVPKREMYSPGVEQADVLEAIGRKVSSKEPDAVKVYRNGQAEYWQFDPLIRESIKGMMQGFDSALLRIASLPAQWFREIVTHSPSFLIRNVLRDMQHRYIISEVNSKLWDSFARQDAETLSKARQYGALGGGYYFRSEKDYLTALREATQELSADKRVVVLDPQRMASWWHELSAKSEYAGRLAEFRAAFEHAKRLGYEGHDAAIYAAYQARDLIDFARSGRVIKFINRFIPFTNANVQGVLRTARAMQQNPTRTLARWAVSVAMPELFVYAWNRYMGAEEEYKEFPSYARDMFHLIKIAPDLWVGIPKPFELGVLGGAVQRALTGDFEGYAGSVAKAWLPVSEEALMGGLKPMDTVAELVANYDFFRARNIVPPWENKMDLELRSTENASRLAQALQQVVGVDARKIDHLIRSYGAGWGSVLTEATSPTVHLQSLLGRMTGLGRPTPGGESESLQRLYRELQRTGSVLPEKDRTVLRLLLQQASQGKTAREREEAKRTLYGLAQALTELQQARNVGAALKRKMRKTVR